MPIQYPSEGRKLGHFYSIQFKRTHETPWRNTDIAHLICLLGEDHNALWRTAGSESWFNRIPGWKFTEYKAGLSRLVHDGTRFNSKLAAGEIKRALILLDSKGEFDRTSMPWGGEKVQIVRYAFRIVKVTYDVKSEVIE